MKAFVSKEKVRQRFTMKLVSVRLMGDQCGMCQDVRCELCHDGTYCGRYCAFLVLQGVCCDRGRLLDMINDIEGAEGEK